MTKTPILLGLTGSIAMGKTETAKLFAKEGLPVFDADADVHKLYEHNGAAIVAIRQLFPQAFRDDVIDRTQLFALLQENKAGLRKLEAVVHPLILKAQQEFIAQSQRDGYIMVVLNIPLLFEIGWDDRVNYKIIVTAPEHIQRERALKRPSMTEEKLTLLLEQQMPDAEKRRRADFIIDTSLGLEEVHRQIVSIIGNIKLNNKIIAQST